MSLPVFHSAAAYVVSQLTEKRTQKAPQFKWSLFFLCVFFANLPDLDMIPGVVFGDSNLFHRGFSHSLIAAAFVFGISLAISSFHHRKRNLRLTRLGFGFIARHLTAVMIGLSYCSHLLLDFMSGPGIPLLWPAVQTKLNFSFRFFVLGREGSSRISSFAGIGSECLSPAFLHPLFFECFILFFFLTAFGVYRFVRHVFESPAHSLYDQVHSQVLMHAFVTVFFALGYVLL